MTALAFALFLTLAASAAPLAWPSAAAAPADPPASPSVNAVVSILPHACFVERVGGPHVAVTVLVGPGQSPHTFEPSARQVAALARAQVYFRTGVDFEVGLVPRIAAMQPNLRIVDLRHGIPLRSMTADELDADDRDHTGHDPAAAAPGPQSQPAAQIAPQSQPTAQTDPHIWLSPPLAKIQARTIADTLAALDPAHAADYRRNLAAFEADLDAVNARIAQALAPLHGRQVFVFHPAFGYFTDAYGLRQVPVEIEGKEPTARQLADLIRRARQAGVKVIFVQPQFPTRAADAVAEAIGGAVVPLDDLPRDYLKNLEDMATKIRTALQPNPQP